MLLLLFKPESQETVIMSVISEKEYYSGPSGSSRGIWMKDVINQMEKHLIEDLNIPRASINFLKKNKYTIVTSWNDEDINNSLTLQLKEGNFKDFAKYIKK